MRYRIVGGGDNVGVATVYFLAIYVIFMNAVDLSILVVFAAHWITDSEGRLLFASCSVVARYMRLQ